MVTFLLITGASKGQVTTFGDSSPEEFAFLPHSGSRIIQGFRVDMGDKKYCIVYSKPAKGSIPDKVFVQQYIKKDLEWNIVLQADRVSDHTLFIWGKRGGFFTDTEKNGIAYTAFSEEDLETEKRFIVGYFILYKGDLITIEENTQGDIIKSSNYNQLPQKAQVRIEEAFGKLDKW